MNSFVRQVGALLLASVLVNFGFYVSKPNDCHDANNVETVQKFLPDVDPPPQRIDPFDAPVAPEIFVYPLPEIDCNDITKKLKRGSIKTPSEMNELRRNVTLVDPACFESNFGYFAKAFLPRIHMKQYNLHIPKTAGTSLCRLVRDNGLKAPAKLCRHKCYCPFWCNYCTTRRTMTCEEMYDSEYHFIGNERWLDHDDSLFCSGYAHSITIREPVARAISNVNMWLGQTCLGKRNFTDLQRTERLQIVQSNYMTWSLTAGTSDYPEAFQPRREHVNLAKRLLTRFDYIIDIETTDCFQDIVEFMGFRKTEIEHHRVAPANYSLAYNRGNYQRLNELDTTVYDFAQDLIRMDCDFFRRIKEEYDIPEAPKRKRTSKRMDRHNRLVDKRKKQQTFKTLGRPVVDTEP